MQDYWEQVYQAIVHAGNVYWAITAPDRFNKAYRLARLEAQGKEIDTYSVHPHLLAAARKIIADCK